MNFKQCDDEVQYATENQMAFRYHTMLPLRNNLPEFIHSKEDADKWLKAYIPAIVKRYKDKAFSFDVVGELIDGKEWRPSAFSDYELICNAFKYARDAAGAHTGLFYNDFGHSSMADGFYQKEKADVVFELVKKLRNDKCGIDGVGFSSHWVLDDENDHVLQGVAQNIKRYEDIGVKVHFTEVDVSCKPEDPKTL